ncbi:MAG TPA: diguanylate cyclase [Candidatus Competibacteraceae bacterium]|nr:diguanylate cyclase [Candidatus Competibacteraceae bacterium]
MGVVKNANDFLRIEHSWVRTILLATAYVVVWIALWYTVIGLNRMLGVNLWAPYAGLTFAVLLEYGWRGLPWPVLAILLSGWPDGFGEHWPYGLAARLAPLFAYLVAVYILRHRPGGERPGEWRFDDPRRVAAFLCAALLGALFAALASAPLSQAAGLSSLTLSWLEMVGQEWIGAFIGIVTIAPLTLIFIAPLARRFVRKEPLRLLKAVPSMESSPVRLGILQGGVSIVLIVALLWMPLPQWLGQSYPLMTLLLLPVLTWIAATYGVRGTTPTVLLYQLSIAVLVLDFTPPELALQYQLAMAIIAASGLLTGAVSQARLVDISRFRDLAEVSNDVLWEFDNHGRLCDLRGHFVRGGDAFQRQLGRHWREYVLQDQEADLAGLQAAFRQRQRFQQLVLRVRLPSAKTPIWTRNSGLPLFDDSGEFRGYRGTTTDISDYKKAEALREQAEALLQDYDRTLEAQVEARVVERTRMLTEVSLRNWRLANFDSLTGLPNRNLFFEHLRKSLQQSRRQWRMLALLLVDLDGFKEVNDTFGHDMGDELLRQVAGRLRQCIRATDTAARLGGDEFTIVLTDLEQADAAEAVARKLVASLAEPAPLGEVSATVTASVGIALYRPEWPANLEQAMALMRQADAAMYEAKRAGKNDWRFAEQEALKSGE